MASNDWFSKNFPTLGRLVALFKGNKGQRRQPRATGQRMARATQQEMATTGEIPQSTTSDPQQTVPEPSPDREKPVGTMPFPSEETAVEQPSIATEPVTAGQSPPVDEAARQTPITEEAVETLPSPSVQTWQAQPPVHQKPAPGPAEPGKRTVPESPATAPESTSVARLPDLAMELEPNLVAARGQMQSFTADRNTAEELRREAQEMLEQAELEWEEAGRLLDVARRACERG